MPKHATAVDKLKALSALFNDEGVPDDATDSEEEFVCDLVDSLIIAEETGSSFTITSEKVEERINKIYTKYQRWLQ